MTTSDTRRPDRLALFRDLALPDTTSIYAQVVAIERHYHRQTGLWLDTREAVRILDQLRLGREGRR